MVDFEELAELLVWHSNFMHFDRQEEHCVDEVLRVMGEQGLMQVEPLQVTHCRRDTFRIVTAKHLNTFRHHQLIEIDEQLLLEVISQLV